MVGIDWGDERSHYGVLDEAGEVKWRGSFETEREAMERHFAGLGPSRVVMETGTHSAGVSRLLKQLGHEGVVANARAVWSISQSGKKTDRRERIWAWRRG